MKANLTDNVWQRKGVSIIWDNIALSELLEKHCAISLREFFILYDKNWAEEDMEFIDDSMLLVAGLDAAIDAMEASEAEEWVIREVYKRIYEFQNWAEGQYALIFWMSNKNRWIEHIDTSCYTWLCDGKDRGKEIELGSGIWNGAQNSVRKIEIENRLVGLFLDRIS